MFAALLTALLVLATSAGSTEIAPVAIEVRSRALRPGDPVRIEVASGCPVETMTGEFLGQSVYMTRAAGDAEGELWSGWSMIGLDQAPGPIAVEIRGRCEAGPALAGTRAVTVERWEFPEERLTVAPKYVEPPESVKQRLQQERARLAEIYRTRRAVAPSNREFSAPVPGAATSAFGTRRVFNGKPRDPHSGLDLRASSGTPVHSSGPGIVTFAQDLYYSGNTVIVDHGGGLFTIYAHLSEIRAQVGDTVDAGALLGLSGATGRVTGPHLHWGAKIGDVPFDPTALLAPELFSIPSRSK